MNFFIYVVYLKDSIFCSFKNKKKKERQQLGNFNIRGHPVITRKLRAKNKKDKKQKEYARVFFLVLFILFQ